MFRLIHVPIIRGFTQEKDEINGISFKYKESNLLLIYYC